MWTETDDSHISVVFMVVCICIDELSFFIRTGAKFFVNSFV
jgi:hypothetical protein